MRKDHVYSLQAAALEEHVESVLSKIHRKYFGYSSEDGGAIELRILLRRSLSVSSFKD